VVAVELSPSAIPRGSFPASCQTPSLAVARCASTSPPLPSTGVTSGARPRDQEARSAKRVLGLGRRRLRDVLRRDDVEVAVDDERGQRRILAVMLRED
jgi:hypothetical protein